MGIRLFMEGKTRLEGIHFLLTYTCNYSCDHCFLYCSPNSVGTFTLNQIKEVLDEALKIKTVNWIFFEGGEPFLYYPIMVEGIKLAKEKGFKVGIVTNSYWATNTEDAEIWLKPFKESGIDELSLSDDTFHYGEENQNLAINAKIAAKNLNLPMSSITIDEPFVTEKEHEKGSPVVGGGAMFRGRAIETLIKDLPKKPWKHLNKCPYEDLEILGRIHIDSYGNAQICQGLSIGNVWKTPLSKMIKEYNPQIHPICGPLIEGGPAKLAEVYNIKHEENYVDECHLCFLIRKSLIDQFPQYIGPKQVYGID